MITLYEIVKYSKHYVPYERVYDYSHITDSKELKEFMKNIRNKKVIEVPFIYEIDKDNGNDDSWSLTFVFDKCRSDSILNLKSIYLASYSTYNNRMHSGSLMMDTDNKDKELVMSYWHGDDKINVLQSGHIQPMFLFLRWIERNFIL